nr:DUF3418 domain-containing protein [Alcaligenaceae bacterium]
EPGSPKDGVTLEVPVYSLNQINPTHLEWLVPGLLKEKVQFLLKSLPQRMRRHCVPVGDYAENFAYRHFEDDEIRNTSLLEVLCEDIWQQKQVRVTVSDFKVENLPIHLRMNIRVIDEHGRMLSSGRNIFQLKSEFLSQTADMFQDMVASEKEKTLSKTQEITDWDFGELPEILEINKKGQSLIGYPALMDCTTHCEIDVFDEISLAQKHHRQGLLRLYLLALEKNIKYWRKAIPDIRTMAMLYMNFGTQEELELELITAVIEQIGFDGEDPTHQNAFHERVEVIQSKAGLILQEKARLLTEILNLHQQYLKKRVSIRRFEDGYEDMAYQVEQLIYPHFLLKTTPQQLAHYPRYFKGILMRIESIQKDPERDLDLQDDFYELWQLYQRRLSQLKGQPDEGVAQFRWQLEELRIALFAQRLRTPMPVSVKRLKKIWHSLSY